MCAPAQQALCAPFFATNCAVLSTIALMSGGGWITPTAWVWLSTVRFSPLRSGAGSASLTSPTATTADEPFTAGPFAAMPAAGAGQRRLTGTTLPTCDLAVIQLFTDLPTSNALAEQRAGSRALPNLSVY